MNPKRRRGQRKASLVVQKSVVVAGHKTSVTLEGAFCSSKHSCLRTCQDNQNRTPTRQQPFVRDPPVHSRLLPTVSLMAPNPKHPPGPPMTLGNVRQLGVQRISFFARAATMQWRHERVLRSRH
jgi:hypothetical protein